MTSLPTRVVPSRLALVLVALAPAARAGGDPAPQLLVSSYTGNTVHVVDPDSGALVGSLGSVPGAQSAVYGPDGDLYVVSETTDRVLRFDGTTGAPLGPFVADDPLTPEDETGGLDAPTAAVFGPDGHLYVASFSGDSVLRYDGATGAFDSVFVDPGEGNLDGPDAGMAFGPDGLLWVPSFNNNRILRFDPATGAFFDKFAGSGTGLRNPRVLLFRSDGTVYVSSWGSDQVLRYALDGTVIGPFADVFRPTGLAFEPGTGHLLATSDNASFVRRFDAHTGVQLADVVVPGSGLASATFLAWLPDVDLHLDRLAPGTAGANTIAVRNGPPSSALVLLAGTEPLSLAFETCAALWLGVNPVVALVLPTDASGEAAVAVTLGPGLVGTTLRLSAYDPVACRLSNLVVQTVE